jgi:hypothetical protein
MSRGRGRGESSGHARGREKADQVRAIDEARIARDLERLGLHLADGSLPDRDLAHALGCYESRKVYLESDSSFSSVGHYVLLTDDRRRAYRDIALEAIAARGGTFPSDAGVWRSDGKRLWKSMA